MFPNPKTSGNGRYTYLGAYAYALGTNGDNDAKARAFVGTVLANVPVFDTGGRGATTTFVERADRRCAGDVRERGELDPARSTTKSALQIVYPSVSVRADFPVAVVDKVVDRHGTRDVATAYLQFLYSDAGQDILAKNFNRVRSPAVAAQIQIAVPGREAGHGRRAASAAGSRRRRSTSTTAACSTR